MKTRFAIALLAGLVYGGYRVLPQLRPATPVAPLAVVPFEQIARLAHGMSAQDKAAMREAYLTLSRSVSADPADDPVFVDVAAVRRAHRAALLFVWKGVLDNKSGEVPGLRDALEGAISSRVGTDEVPLNPSLKAETAKAFSDIAASFR